MNIEVSKESKMVKIKKHFREKREVYIASTITGLTCIVGTLILVRKVKNSLSVTAETAVGNANTIHNQTINVLSIKKGHPGFPVRCKELNRIWKTQAEAASELGFKPSHLSECLHFKRDHINGLTFERMIPESTMDQYLMYW